MRCPKRYIARAIYTMLKVDLADLAPIRATATLCAAPDCASPLPSLTSIGMSRPGLLGLLPRRRDRRPQRLLDRPAMHTIPRRQARLRQLLTVRAPPDRLEQLHSGIHSLSHLRSVLDEHRIVCGRLDKVRAKSDHHSYIAVTADAVVEPLARVLQDGLGVLRSRNSVRGRLSNPSEQKHAYAAALSKQDPTRPIDRVISISTALL